MTVDPVEQRKRDDLRLAVRTLLRTPLLRRSSNPTGYEIVRRSLDLVGRWFSETAGWFVVYDRPAEVIRLRKVADRLDHTRAAGREFTRRHYTLLVLLLAELDRVGRQITLKRLAESLRDATAAELDLATFDATIHDERRAFVHVVRWLIEQGVLSRRDGDEELFLRSGTRGDALYDVATRALGLLLAAPRSPSSVSAPEQISEVFYANTEDGQKRLRRHSVYRRLLDDPVVYYEDLDAQTRDWLIRSLRSIAQRMQDVGLVLERRYEGLAAIDPEGDLTDRRFPVANSTSAHAALLIAEWLSTARTARLHEVEARVAAWRKAPVGGRWRKQTPREISSDALDVLRAFQLVRVDGDRVHARPAIARFRAESKDNEA